MTTRFNEFTSLVRGAVHVAIGIAAVSIYDSPAGETTFEKLNDLAPMVTARNGSIAVGINSNGFILVSSREGEWRPAAAPQTRFRGVAYGGNKFVAVGDCGAVAVSADGIEWTKIHSPTAHSLYSVVFGHGKFVAVGNEGAILRSSDGIRWSSANVTDTRLRGIVFGNGEFVAVGHEGLILSSRDGWNWFGHKARTTERLESVAFGNGRFVAVGWKGTVVSGGRDRWKHGRIPGEPRLVHVYYQHDAFHSISENGRSISSTDGVVWGPLEMTSERAERTVAFAH
jgi:hypothetical protein